MPSHTYPFNWILPFWWTLNSSKQPSRWSYHCSHWSTFIFQENRVSCRSCSWLPSICSLSSNLPTLFTAASLCHCLVCESAGDATSGHCSMWRSLLGAPDYMSLLSIWRQGKENPSCLWTEWCMAMILGMAAKSWVHEGSCCLVVQLIHHEWQREDLERI